MSQRDHRSVPMIVDEPSDRRQFARRFAETAFVAGSIFGRLVDVSESGLGIEASRPIPVLLRGTFTLDIGRARPRFQGQVRWCRLVGTAASDHGDTHPIYRAGVALFHS